LSEIFGVPLSYILPTAHDPAFAPSMAREHQAN
jgi:hypothetical protein